MQKFVLRSALRPNRISFSHDQDPERSLAVPKFRSAVISRLILANRYTASVVTHEIGCNLVE
jgi:hypothetical protein